MTFEQLKDKALSLPLEPGVYIMRDQNDRVIYVGKAKKLKNRVAQYFQDTASHTPKTRLMVGRIDHFDVIVAASEFEALVLECSLIKRYMPKFNILLKDDKGYPYIRLDMKMEFPTLTMVSRIASDGALYFGPYGSRGITQDIIDTLKKVLRLPSCKRKFPRDLGAVRPCLNYHMNLCDGWCVRSDVQQEFYARMEQIKQVLSGNYKKVAEQIRMQMAEASENLEFEVAALLRDQLLAMESLAQKQLVTASSLADTDVIGYAQTEAKACFTVLHYAGGNLLDKDYEVFPVQDDPEASVSSLIKQYYLGRGLAPKNVLLPFALEDAALFEDLLQQQTGRHVHLRVPQRGDNARLVALAAKNAMEEAQRVTSNDEKRLGTLSMLSKMLVIPMPHRIESFDISNISGTDIVASMIVFTDGRPDKCAYKRFKIDDLHEQDDYASMRQVLMRRLDHYLKGDDGFETPPDLLLIDGGMTHAKTAMQVLRLMNLEFPVFGMVKDDRHRTRALVTHDGLEIAIDGQQAVFALIGNIQEETHRFAIGYHRKLRSKRLQYSALDSIPGIGKKRKQQLLKRFKSLKAIAAAELSALERILPKDAAHAVFQHFHSNGSDL